MRACCGGPPRALVLPVPLAAAFGSAPLRVRRWRCRRSSGVVAAPRTAVIRRRPSAGLGRALLLPSVRPPRGRLARPLGIVGRAGHGQTPVSWFASTPRARLRAHHSAQFGGMQRRGGGGNGGSGKGGANDAQAARQLLLSLFDGALAGRGGGSAVGRAGSKGRGRQAYANRQRDGEWQCQCGFGTNRPSRDFCFSCGRSREVAQVGVKGGARRFAGDGLGQKGRPMGTAGGGSQWYGGPVGAGGSRPLLGGRGHSTQDGSGARGLARDAPRTPAWSGKGPAYAASSGKASVGKGAQGGQGAREISAASMGKGQAATSTGETGQGKAAWGRPRTIYDAEGYELVQPRRVRIDGGTRDEGDRTTQGQARDSCNDSPATTPTRCRWSDDMSDDEGECGEDHDGEGEGDGADDDDGWGTDPRRLRATFEEHARAVKGLEKAGGYGPALDTMRLARDEAERRWREAKAPAPLPKRLIWAEAKLQKAQSALTRARLQLDQFDEETDRRRAEFLERIGEAERWHEWRQEQLERIHDEAAGGAAARASGLASGAGSTEVRRRLRGQVLPEMQAILEAMQEGTDLHERLSLVVANLADAETKLGPNNGDDDADRYDMYDGDTVDDDWEADDPRATELPETAQGDRRDEGPGGHQRCGRPTEWKAEGTGRWTRASNADGGRTQPRYATEEGGAAQATSAAADARGPGERVGATCQGEGAQGSGVGTQEAKEREEATTERAGKHRRRQTEAEREEEERRASDARRAQELQEQLRHASAAQQQSYQEGMGGFGSESALSWAAQRFVLDVQRAQAQANEMGIEAKSEDGRTLLELSPMELKQWTERHLDEGSMRD